ncbi:Sds3-like-domain-containing protein [Mucor mucedo]|uniref:Sds3-like-domain-containing protein n=1 Tax=Mucor mucedo TaxID=29922 RepID=UPI00222033A4|nr:Sds3-like-domain-containing protein [Mucor mucedo]KAI7889758.1 Sds3-like-domain-containing protein [Mucor mucedo]
MLETNKPYMFGSSTTTTTATTAPVSSQSNTNNHLPGLQQHHHNNFYYTGGGNNNRQEEESTEGEHYTSYHHGQPARLNSAFGRHLEANYTYKENTTSFTRPIVYSSPIVKREEASLIMPPTKPPVPLDEPAESSWFENSTLAHSDGLYADSSDGKRIKRRKEMTSKMEKLNSDFLDKKEGLYTENLVLINTELKEAHGDTHYQYVEGLRNLEGSRQKMIDDGRLFKEYQKQVTDKQFQLEIYQAQEEYTAETQEIREKLFTILEEKRRKLKEDKDNCDLAYDVVLESQSRLHKRNLRKRGPENADNKASKRKQMNDILFFVFIF